MPASPRRRNDPLPRPDISLVLQELGVDPRSIPTGYGWRRMRCPFHEDRTASASVNHDPERGGFVCHANDQCPRGDGLKLLMQGLGLTFTKAVERAANLNPTAGSGSHQTKRRRASDILKGGQG